MQRGKFIVLSVMCSLLTACGGIPQKVFIEESSTEPIIIREETVDRSDSNEEQNDEVKKSGLSNVYINPDFSNVEQATQELLESSSVQNMTDNLPEDPTQVSKKSGPCIDGEEHRASVANIQAPTCEIEGINETKCNICGITLGYANVAALGHDWTDYTITNATCTEDGAKTRTCKRCNKKEAEVIKASGTHNFGSYIETVTATCTSVGKQVRTCKNCNKTETKEVPMIDHSFGDWSTSTVPTCSIKGVQTRTCKKCGYLERKELDRLSHSAGDWEIVLDATCITTGLKVKYCILCGEEVERETIPLTDHNYEVFEKEDGSTVRVCSICESKEE